MPEEVGRFSFKFGVDKHEIDAGSYGIVLVNAVKLLEEANIELRTNAHFEFRVRAEKESSYLCEIVLHAAQAILGVSAPLLTPEGLELAKRFGNRVVSEVGKVLNLHKQSRGESPKQVVHLEDGSVNITGDNYGTINVDNSTVNLLFRNSNAQKSVRDIFDALDDDQEIDDFSMLDENHDVLFESEKADFPQLTKKMDLIEEDKRKMIKKAELSISRQSFERNKISDFIYLGNSISASIVDVSFWELVERGERFAKGDKLFVDLEISQEFNKTLDAFENKGYKILIVNEHRPRPEQPKLF